ncbi:DUF6612 family protein [Enterocloster clostridioformis]|uniref:DUF4412 domain-containing protein n=1 Tax=Enterocloster clostridioformis TaxID=1531 RepID=A0A1I0JEX6_9FIRM|nr:DUF6612 family protein [Enterocloster clostridioformis]SEU08440.1 hypothetical protein SAMN05216521_105541 [Enterocloster clostridioformis]SEW45206.1 hypothetical protein SAMN05216528_10532 [Enterocloster clostridioformis]
MKLKKLVAVTMGFMMAFTVSVYANDADAVAVYEEMNQKQKSLTDVNAYLDYLVKVNSDAMKMESRVEMNMKANHITVPENLRMNTYTRMTINKITTGDPAEGPGKVSTNMNLSDKPMISNMYYEDGMYYMETMGQKIKQPMPLEQIMKSVQQIPGMENGGLEYIQNLKLRTEGEDRILSYTMDVGKMNELLDQVMGMSGMSAMVQSGAQISYDDISGEMVVGPDGFCKKSRMKMGMKMTMGESTISMSMDGDVGYADPGQPVEFPTPDLNGYQLLEIPQ